VGVAWLSTRGTSRHDSLSAADGFCGEHPFAAVATVAEGTGGERRPAEVAVSIIRDIFAEGVAYRVGEALVEAFSEAGEKIRSDELRGCSATSVAILGRDAWVVHAGGCRAFLVGPAGVHPLTEEHTLAGEMGLAPSDPGYRQRSRDLTLQLGQKDLKPQSVAVRLGEGESIVICSGSIWRHLDPARMTAAMKARSGADFGAEAILRESKARFRRQGGAVASATATVQAARSSGLRRPGWLRIAGAVLATAALAFLASRIRCGGEPMSPAREPVREDQALDGATILPIPDIAESLEATAAVFDTLPAIVFGGAAAPFGPDTLDAFLTPAPDSAFEHIPSGVYFVSSDSTARAVAEALAERVGLGAPVALDRIVVVREADVPAFAAWLPRVSAQDAGKTAVIVETRSSVAGGASWIRSYAVYANGNRARNSGGSSYFGLPLEGLPASPDSTCYRLLFRP